MGFVADTAFPAFFRGLADGPRVITHKNKTRNVSVRSYLLTRSPSYKDKDINGVTQPRVLSLSPFQIARGNYHACTATLTG